MTHASELGAAFERLAINALGAGTGSFGGFSELAEIVPFDHPAVDDYDAALRLLRNVGRGVALQRGRVDADRVWEVTRESVSKLNTPRYQGLLSSSVVELLGTMCAEAEREAQAAAQSTRN